MKNSTFVFVCIFFLLLHHSSFDLTNESNYFGLHIITSVIVLKYSFLSPFDFIGKTKICISCSKINQFAIKMRQLCKKKINNKIESNRVD